MNNFIIKDDNGNTTSYPFISYMINPHDNYVIVKFNSLNDNSVSYKLDSDAVFKTVDSIIDYLENILRKAISSKNPLTINEYLTRDYITISFDNIPAMQFTAHKN